ncbi:TPA: alpha/beta hydrolase [Pseudomonas aeruginosa]|nr:alpha/beta hydrolase [Pseudomonas aeruginosa]
MSQSVFFAHANGFPSATCAKLFEALAPEYRVDHLEMHGHDPRFPVNDNWDNLVDELLHHLASLEQPVWGVGHSLGGVLHYHAALRRPELYRGVVMLDSPVLTLADRLVIRAAKRFGFIDRITPAGRTLGASRGVPRPGRGAGVLLRQGAVPPLRPRLPGGLRTPRAGRQRRRFRPAPALRSGHRDQHLP